MTIDTAEIRRTLSSPNASRALLSVYVRDLLAECERLTDERDSLAEVAQARWDERDALAARVKVLERALTPYAAPEEWTYDSEAATWRLLFNSTDRDGDGWEMAAEALRGEEVADG